MSRFKEDLLDELIAHARQAPPQQVARASQVTRAPRRRRVAVASALAALLAGTVALLFVVPFGQSPAYAVVKRADGSVSMTWRDLADPAAATRDLLAAGVPARVVQGSPLGSCPTGGDSGAQWQWPQLPPPPQPQPPADTGGQLSISFSRPSDPAIPSFPEFATDFTTNGFTVLPDLIPDGAAVLIVEYRTSHGSVVIGLGLVDAPAPTCAEIDPARP